METRFNVLDHPGRMDVGQRDMLLADPGFGRHFTDHMVTVKWREGEGWHDAQVGPRGPLTLDPACAVLHYAQEIFEGLKAYRQDDGGIALFRPEANARRFNTSARRLAMPDVPEDLFIGAIEALLQADRDWFPSVEGGTIYLRPFMFASEAFLGVRPAKEYLFIVIASPAGNYFKGAAPAVTLWVSQDFSRAGPGGTGEAKCGGNYAASLLPQAEAIAKGCDQVMFLDAVEHRYIDELGGMNMFFLFDDGSMVTPQLGTILPGITRDSILTLAREAGMAVREERYAIDQLAEDARSGRLVEAFACGTAAVVTPVGRILSPTLDISIGNGGAGERSAAIKQQLLDIQRGRTPDTHGWIRRVALA